MQAGCGEPLPQLQAFPAGQEDSSWVPPEPEQTSIAKIQPACLTWTNVACTVTDHSTGRPKTVQPWLAALTAQAYVVLLSTS